MAQLDSASDSDSDGWRFESVWVRHSKTFAFCKGLFFAYQTDSVPVADAIDTLCSNRYYARPARYKSAWVYHSKTAISIAVLSFAPCVLSPFQ